jgi:hypothetical protein
MGIVDKSKRKNRRQTCFVGDFELGLLGSVITRYLIVPVFKDF